MLTCLLHADDYGLTPGVTDGILEAVRRDRLHSTSVMCGGLHADEAMRALRDLPQVFVGTHLNLLEGKASADPALLPDLVDGSGFFRLGLAGLLYKLFQLGKKAEKLREQVFIEFCAQIDAVRQGTGRGEVRLDGHLHVHAIPALVPVMDALIRKYPVSYLRIPRELRYVPVLPSSRWVPGVLCRELLALWSPFLRRRALRLGVPVPDYFIGAYASGSLSLAALRRGLERTAEAAAKKSWARPPLVEFMFHPGCAEAQPGWEQAQWYGASHYAGAHGRPERAAELALLLSPEFWELLREFDVVPLRPPLATPAHRAC